MATRTISNAGGNWNDVASWVEGAYPGASDDVVATASSGNLTLNLNGASCRSMDLTGYTGTITHNASVILNIGTSTANASKVALKLAGTYTPVSASSSQFSFSSTSGEQLTVDLGGKTIARLNFILGNHILLSDVNAVDATSFISHTGGTFNTGNYNISTGYFQSTGAVARTLTLGSSVFTLSGSGGSTPRVWEMAGTNLTITANTALIKFTGATTRFFPGGYDMNGASLYIQGPAGTCYIYNGGTIKDLIVDPSSTQTLTFESTKTLTITGDIHCVGKNGEITWNASTANSASIVSKNSGAVNFYNTSLKDITLTGGATYNGYHNCTNVSGNTGITFNGGTWYLDFENGLDTNINSYGWWKADYTGATGTRPSAGDTATGASSTKTATLSGLVDPLEWVSGSGTIYFVNKSGTFVSEQLNFNSGGHVDISGDFSYASWKTITYGAEASRIAPGDTIKCAKTKDPTLLDTARWTNTPTTNPPTINISSSTNASPIQITTSVAHGFVNGDIVLIDSHTVNTEANGAWIVTKVNDTAFTLNDSTGIGTGGANGNARKIDHLCVVLNNAHTKTINRGGEEGNWTGGSANYTPSLNAIANTSRREGSYAIKIAVLAGAGANQKAAYFNTSTLNLSGYQQVSFWINSSVKLDAGDWELRLCSDDAGNTAVNIISIPEIKQINGWFAVTVDLGVNLGSAIESISLWQIVDKGAFNIYIDNIVACKASSSLDSITLSSLISKSDSASGGSHPFFCIQNISKDGKILMLANKNNLYFSQNPSYYGVSETVPTYKRECINPGVPSAYNAGSQIINDSGTQGMLITFDGGYDVTNNSQNGSTYLDGFCWWGLGIYIKTRSYIKVNNFSLVRFHAAINSTTTCSNIIIDNVQTVSQCANYGIYISSTSNFTLSNVNGINQCYGGLTIDSGSNNGIITNIKRIESMVNTGDCIDIDNSYELSFFDEIENIAGAYNNGISISGNSKRCYFENIKNIQFNGNHGVYFNGSYNTIDYIDNVSHNTLSGFAFVNSSYNIIKKVITNTNNVKNGIHFSSTANSYNQFNDAGQILNNTNWAIQVEQVGWDNIICNMISSGNGSGGISCPTQVLILKNCTINDTTYMGALTSDGHARISMEREGSIIDNHKIFEDGSLISSDISTRHTESGISWSLSPTSTSRNIFRPVILKLAKIACAAGTEVTFKVFCKKSHSTDIAAKIVCRSGQLEGLTSYQEDTKADDVDWEELQVKFTPSEIGVVEIEGWAWWVANTADESVWFDDITVTQL